MTALHEASFCGKAEIVTLLIKNGADVNKKDIPGRAPLEIAKKKRHQHVAKILQAAGGKE
jgi:ankyrin repeat protein